MEIEREKAGECARLRFIAETKEIEANEKKRNVTILSRITNTDYVEIGETFSQGETSTGLEEVAGTF